MKLTLALVAVLATIAFGRMENMIGTTICKGKRGRAQAICFSRAACMYLNQIRRRNGLPPMALGTKSMLSNALNHCKRQSARGSLFHQSMGGKLGRGKCATTLSAENVAMFMDSRVYNPAAQCTLQWRDSPGHFENMMSRTSKVCAVGIYKDPSGSWWCTQTFSWDKPDRKCNMDTGAGSGPPPTSPRSRPPTSRPKSRPRTHARPPSSRSRPPRRAHTSRRKPFRPRLSRRPRMCLKAKKVQVWKLRGRSVVIKQICKYHPYKCKCRFCVHSGSRRSCFDERSSRYLDSIFSIFY